MLNVYSVYDRTANTWSTPFFAAAHPVAIRDFYVAVRDERTLFHKSPQDFRLFCLGTFDPSADTMPVMPDDPLVLAEAIAAFPDHRDDRD